MEGRDYISCLTDSVLLRILRLLPTVEAVRTIYVPRFRYLWTSLPSLSFDQCEFCRCSESGPHQMEFHQEFMNFVNSVLILHNSLTLDRFSLSMEFCLPGTEPVINGDNIISPWRVSNMIGAWIHFALCKKVRILNLDFAGCQGNKEDEDPGYEHYVLPSIVLRSRSLVELYLDRCCIKLFVGIQLKSLRLLSLRRIWLNDLMANQILSGCPLLEELSLQHCSGLNRLTIMGPTSLKKLDIGIAYMDTLDISLSSIKFLKLYADILNIICPTITHLDIDFQLIHMSFSDLPSVVEATISLDRCHLNRDDNDNPSFRSLLPKLSNVTSIKPCPFFIGNFPAWDLTNHPCLSFNWKCVTTVLGFAKWRDLTNHPCLSFNWKCVTTVLGFAKWIVPGIYRFLSNSACLESLVIYAFPFDAAPDDMSEKTEADELDTGYNGGPVGGGTFDGLKHHLKNITIQGDITKPYIVDLIEFLLGNSLVLEKMLISSKRPPETYRNKYRHERSQVTNPVPPVSMVELSQLVSCFHRASSQAEVCLVM